MRYLKDHWRGTQSFLWSFWVNFIALRIIVYLSEPDIYATFVTLDASFILLAAAYILAVHIFLLGWQIMGATRAAERKFKQTGSYEWLWASHLGVVIALALTVGAALDTVQSAAQLYRGAQVAQAEITARATAAKYAFTVVRAPDIDQDPDTGQIVHLKGSFELGISRDLAAFIQAHDNVSGLILTSHGGRIYEGRAIAALVMKLKLNTYVLDYCNSSCTTAFIGGERRQMGANAKLGFHQYRLDARLQHPFIDLQHEQRLDRTFYASRQIAPQFLQQVFAAPHTDLWQPTHAALLSAGVVHEILP